MKEIVKLIMSLFSYHTEQLKKSSNDIPSKPDSTQIKSTGSLVKEEDGYYVWNKGENHVLTPYFSTNEFSCKCNFPDCKKQRISKSLVVRLDLIRKEIKQPLVITSAYRCQKHQAFLRSSGVNTVVAKQSTHEQGNAVDVVPKDQKDIQGEFLKICEKQFDSIGLSHNFLHLDLRVGKRRWQY